MWNVEPHYAEIRESKVATFTDPYWIFSSSGPTKRNAVPRRGDCAGKMSAAFSATATTAALVLPRTMDGITDASTTFPVPGPSMGTVLLLPRGVAAANDV